MSAFTGLDSTLCNSLTECLQFEITGFAVDEDLPCLGGSPQQESNPNASVNQGATHARLPRPGKLPPPFFKVRKGNPEAYKAYMKLWDGDFVMSCALSPELLMIHARLEENSDLDLADEYVGYIYTAWIEIAENRPAMAGTVNPSFASYNAFQSAFTEKAKFQLSLRIIYHCLRSIGGFAAQMWGPVSAWNPVNLTIEKLEDFHKKQYHSLLDLAILRADIFFNYSAPPRCRAAALVAIGRALEALGEFHQAAQIYKQAKEVDGSVEVEASMLQFAAEAYRKGGYLDEAEEHFIYALHSMWRRSENHQLNLQDDSTSHLLKTVIDFFAFRVEQRGRLENLDTKLEIGQVYPVFVALADLAGMKYPHTEDCIYHVMQQVSKPSIHAQLHNQDAALEHLSLAVKLPDKAHFYKTLSDCLTNHKSVVIDTNVDKAEQCRLSNIEESQKFFTKILKPGKSYEIYCGCTSCPNRRVSPEDESSGSKSVMPRCPCKTISYCDKTCQRAHWSEHKNYCSWHLARNKKIQT